MLRETVGCDSEDFLKLTPAERARCHERFGAEARKQPPLSGIDPLRRGAFAASADQARKCRHYDTPVPLRSGTDRNEGPGDFDPQRPESQRGESTANNAPAFNPFHPPCLP